MHRFFRLPHLSPGLVALCLALTFAGGALANDGGSFLESPMPIEVPRADGLTQAPEKLLQNPQGLADLIFYNDRAAFEAAAPGLKKEDFEGGTAGPGQVVGCGSPLDSNASPCFAAGDIESGLEVHASSETNIVALGPGIVPVNPTTWVGSDLFNDVTSLEFTDPDVFAVGFDVFDFFGAPTPTTAR